MLLRHARLPFRHTRRCPRGERRDLNPRPLGPQPSALPPELRSPRVLHETGCRATLPSAAGRSKSAEQYSLLLEPSDAERPQTKPFRSLSGKRAPGAYRPAILPYRLFFAAFLLAAAFFSLAVFLSAAFLVLAVFFDALFVVFVFAFFADEDLLLLPLEVDAVLDLSFMSLVTISMMDFRVLFNPASSGHLCGLSLARPSIAAPERWPAMNPSRWACTTPRCHLPGHLVGEGHPSCSRQGQDRDDGVSRRQNDDGHHRE